MFKFKKLIFLFTLISVPNITNSGNRTPCKGSSEYTCSCQGESCFSDRDCCIINPGCDNDTGRCYDGCREVGESCAAGPDVCCDGIVCNLSQVCQQCIPKGYPCAGAAKNLCCPGLQCDANRQTCQSSSVKKSTEKSMTTPAVSAPTPTTTKPVVPASVKPIVPISAPKAVIVRKK